MIECGGWQWRAVGPDDADALGTLLDVDACTTVIEQPVPDTVVRDLAMVADGRALQLGPVLGDRLLGYVGVIACADEPGRVEISTVLAPELWGTGANTVAKRIQWTIGRELLGHKHLLAYVRDDNPRSLASMRRHWSSARTRPGAARPYLRFELREPPLGWHDDPRLANALALELSGQGALVELRARGHVHVNARAWR